MEKSNHYQPAVDYHTMNGWLECVSKGSGKKYYYNTSTCESTWEVPAEFLRATKKSKPDKPRISEAELSSEQTPKKYKGEGLLLTPTTKSNGTHHIRTGPATPIVATTQLRHDNHHDLLRHDKAGAASRASSSTSRRQSLNHRSSEAEYVSLHEAIPSPVINREHKTHSNNSSHNSSPIHHKRDMMKSDRALNNSSSSSSSQKLSKLLSASLDVSQEETPDQEDIMRTKFLDPSSISLLTNQPAEILERQSNQLHQDARRLLDVDLLRTIADCANLRAVQNVQSLRVLNIEHKLNMLRDHIKWLEEGNDFT
ncbi:WW domain-containing adapter protein with coiled-coil-like [Bolinopsis microptera]|uniref:WW domain-containing adapter protein with coiled-coil-like n=1 Tax=Bolinopsis microptera TaxID=2820187 RepID=UPI0030793FE8